MRAPFLFALCAVALGACAKNEPPDPALLDLSAVSCTATPSLDGAIPLAYSPKDEVRIQGALDTQSACLATPDGTRSLYAVYALPDIADPYLVRVGSLVAGNAVLAPHIVMLSADGKKTREIAPDAFVFRSAELSALFHGRTGERYLLIESDPQAVGKGFSRVSEATQTTTAAYATASFAGSFTIHTGNDVKSDHLFSHAGKFSIVLQPVPVAK